MEPILDWNIQARFIEVKNDEEESKWIVPYMHYLLEVTESQAIPFEYDLRERIFDVDLLYFVYTVIYPIPIGSRNQAFIRGRFLQTYLKG
jgi:hypothetical protein